MNFDRKDRDDVLTEDTKAFDAKLTDDKTDFTVREIQMEKEKLDQRYKARLEELDLEKGEQERLYSERIEQLKSEDRYKEELIRSQLVKVSEEKSKSESSLINDRDEILMELQERELQVKDKLQKIKLREEEKDNKFREKLAALDEEKNKKVEKKLEQIRSLQQEIKEIEEEYQAKHFEQSRDQSYKQEILSERQDIELEIEELKRNYDYRVKEWQREKQEQDELRRQRESTLQNELYAIQSHLQEKVDKLEELKRQQMEEIGAKIQVLLKEKMKCDELYQLKMEKFRQDELYKNRELSLKQEIKQQESLYQNRLRDFEKRRIEREEHLEEESRPDIVTGLGRLKDMKGYRVAKGDHDVRGWDVLGSNSERVGKVKELIVDPELMKVRYLNISISKDLMDNGDEERELLIPIGAAELDEQNDNVLLPALDRTLLAKLPHVTGETVTRDYEHTLLTALSSDYNPSMYNNETFYEQSHFDDSRFYNSRRRKD